MTTSTPAYTGWTTPTPSSRATSSLNPRIHGLDYPIFDEEYREHPQPPHTRAGPRTHVCPGLYDASTPAYTGWTLGDPRNPALLIIPRTVLGSLRHRWRPPASS